jgi:Ca-activated chloride channel homolog
MIFLYSNWFFVLLPFLILLFFIIFKSEKTRFNRVKKLLPKIPINYKKARFINVALTISIFTLILITLIRPSSGFKKISIPISTTDIIILLDISKSMRAIDVKPSRLKLAQKKIQDLITNLSNQKDFNPRIGIVLFSNVAYNYCPLTEDLRTVEFYVNSLSNEMMSGGGSSLNSGITLAVDSFKNNDSQNPILLIATDGEDDSFEISRDLTKLNKSNTTPKIVLYGIGTVKGGPIPLNNQSFQRMTNGELVITRLNDEKLRSIADNTKGLYSRWQVSNKDINEIINFIKQQKNTSHNSRRSIKTIPNDFGYYIMWFVLLLFLIPVIKKRAIMTISLIFIFSNSECFSQDLARQAYQAYSAKDFVKSETLFRQLNNKKKSKNSYREGLAYSLFQQKKYRAAVKEYTKIIKNSPSPLTLYRALYNRGTSYLALKEWNKAKEDLEKATHLRPDIKKASHNRDIAKYYASIYPTPSPTPTAQTTPPQQQATPTQQPNSTSAPSSTPKSGSNNKNNQADATPKDKDQGKEKNPENLPKPDKNLSPEQQQKIEEEKAEAKKTSAEIARWLDNLPEAPILLKPPEDQLDSNEW